MAKKGGTAFGNIFATVANRATGGLLGAKRVGLLQSNPYLINANSPASKALSEAISDQPLREIIDPIRTKSINQIRTSDVKPIDLNDYFKLPEASFEPKQIVYMLLGFFGLMVALKFINPKN